MRSPASTNAANGRGGDMSEAFLMHTIWVVGIVSNIALRWPEDSHPSTNTLMIRDSPFGS